MYRLVTLRSCGRAYRAGVLRFAQDDTLKSRTRSNATTPPWQLRLGWGSRHPATKKVIAKGTTLDFIDKLQDLIGKFQSRTAELAIGPSTLRNQGAPGVVDTARKYLMRLDLKQFNDCTQKDFQGVLDKETKKLQNQFPEGAKNWGAARKALNIFLRDALYNHYLREHYKLQHIASWLEIPLDSHVAGRLRGEYRGSDLSKWPGIRHMDSDISDEYQCVAEQVAGRRGVARVHLDLFYWRAAKPVAKE